MSFRAQTPSVVKGLGVVGPLRRTCAPPTPLLSREKDLVHRLPTGATVAPVTTPMVDGLTGSGFALSVQGIARADWLHLTRRT